MSRAWLAALAASGLCLTVSCSDRSPFVVLSIEDPAEVATGFATLHVGFSRDALELVKVSASTFPLAVTVTAEAAGEKTLWAEARDADGAFLARGRTEARFARQGTPTATVQLTPACDTDGDCANGLFCDGTESCVDGSCIAGTAACAANVECVTTSCVELGGGSGRCDTAVHHESCPTGSYCNPVRGCVEGQGCFEDIDCADVYVCNGTELCINLVCTGGPPPGVDDGDACTVDGCDDTRTGVGEEAVFHVALESFDGRDCALPNGGGDGVCVSAKGGCVVSECGDGVQAADEDCEDGNANPNDGCDACKSTSWLSRVLVGGGEGQGVATRVSLAGPRGLVVDRRGNLFVAESARAVVVRVDAQTGIVTTTAGTGSPGFSGDGGAATSAELQWPAGIAADGLGNLYIADSSNHRVRRVDGRSGVITTVAGTGIDTFAGDGGLATSATLRNPNDVSVDGSGNLFIADSGNSRIRRVDGTSGVITTVAGGGSDMNPDGGPATAAALGSPGGVSVDGSGNLFIAQEFENRVRRVDGQSGIITTVAGNGGMGFSGDDGPAVDAELQPSRVSVDGSGNLFIADWWNNRVRRVDRASGIITTVAGSGPTGPGVNDCSGDGGPATSAILSMPAVASVDGSGNLFIADDGNNRIRRVDATSRVITTAAGTGAPGFSGDNGSATTAALGQPNGVAVDNAGNLFIADTYNHRVRRVDRQSGVITTVAGTGMQGFSGDSGPATSAAISFPFSVGADGVGNLFIADTSNNRVRRVDGQTGVISTVAGSGVQGFSGDTGPATDAELNQPTSVSVDGAGNLFIVDPYNRRIRRVDGQTGIITTVAGGGSVFGDDGPATSATLDFPWTVAADASGNLFIADNGDGRVRRVDGVTGVIKTLAGIGATGFAGDDGPATSAKVRASGVALDGAGNVFIADEGNSRVRRVDHVSGVITTVVGSALTGFSGDGGPATTARLLWPKTVAVDGSGNIYVADSPNDRVRRVDGVTGIITTVAGFVDPVGDGPVLSSAFSAPTALVLLSAAEWLVADGVSGRVRSLDLARGWVGSEAGYVADVYATEPATARYSRLLLEPRGIAFDPVGETVFVSERGGHTIRAIDVGASPWSISTFAGALNAPGYLNDNGASARFSNPSGLLFVPSTRELLVADAGNHVIRAIDVDSGATSTIAGTPRFRGFFGEGVDAADALFNGPQAMALGKDGSLYVADTGNNRVRRITPSGVIDTVLGDGTAASSGEGGPARYFPVDQPMGLAVDSFGNLFVSSSTAVKVVTAGDDDLATGDDEVLTLYGRPPRELFPEPVTYCLAGIAVVDGDAGAQDGRLYVLDACAGFMLELDRQAH